MLHSYIPATDTQAMQPKRRLIASSAQNLARGLFVPDQYQHLGGVAVAAVVRCCEADQGGRIRGMLAACTESAITVLEFLRHERPFVLASGSQSNPAAHVLDHAMDQRIIEYHIAVRAYAVHRLVNLGPCAHGR